MGEGWVGGMKDEWVEWEKDGLNGRKMMKNNTIHEDFTSCVVP